METFRSDLIGLIWLKFWSDWRSWCNPVFDRIVVSVNHRRSSGCNIKTIAHLFWRKTSIFSVFQVDLRMGSCDCDGLLVEPANQSNHLFSVHVNRTIWSLSFIQVNHVDQKVTVWMHLVSDGLDLFLYKLLQHGGRHGNTMRPPTPVVNENATSPLLNSSLCSLFLLPLSSLRRYRWVRRVPGCVWWRPVHQHPGDVPVPVLWRFHVIGGYEDLSG